jgi:hypothetical protein
MTLKINVFVCALGIVQLPRVGVPVMVSLFTDF